MCQLEAQAASGKLNPTEEGAEQYNLAMINFLLKMKDKGHKINEKEMDMVRKRGCLHTYIICTICTKPSSRKMT